MSILVDFDIAKAIDQGHIVITPFDEASLGTNSYDVRLARVLKVYTGPDTPLDVRLPRSTRDVVVPDDGFVLQPGELYLASTVEYTETHRHVPALNGKSSMGRYGLSVHVTAGTGDVGFCGHWTMELFVIRPLRVYAGMKIAQLLYHEASDVPKVSYNEKASAKYVNTDPHPQASQAWRNFIEPEER